MQNIQHAASQKFSQAPVTVYLRTFSKHAILLTVPQFILLSQLRKIICARVNTSEDMIVLFHKGQILSNEGSITLKNKDILHVVNFINVDREQIRVNVKMVDGSRRQAFQLSKNYLIRQFVENEFLNMFGKRFEQVFFVYVGKELNTQKTFIEEFVENDSEIICMNNQSNSVRIMKVHRVDQRIREAERLKVNKQKAALVTIRENSSNRDELIRDYLQKNNLKENIGKIFDDQLEIDVRMNEDMLIVTSQSMPQNGIAGQQLFENLTALGQNTEEDQVCQQLNLHAAESGKESSYKDQTPVIKRCQIFDQRLYFSQSDQVQLQQSIDNETQQLQNIQTNQTENDPSNLQILSPTLKPGDLIYSADDLFSGRETFMEEILGSYRRLLGDQSRGQYH